MRQTLNLVGIRSVLTMLLASLTLTLLCPQSGFSQSCSGTLDTVMYTTTFTSTTGNETAMTFTFPKFPVSASTLYAVDIKSYITVWNDMHVMNNYTSALNITTWLFRSDDFYTDVSSDSAKAEQGVAFHWGSVPSGGTGAAGYQINILNQKLNDSIFTGDLSGDNPSAFVGSGNVNLYYNTGSSTINSPNNPYVNSYFNTIKDQMNLTVTYYYCTPSTLAVNLLSFTAVRQNEQNALLAWSITNEVQGAIYHVQVGTDGATFTDYAAVNADPVNSDGSYSYTYPILPNASGKLYFRLRISDPNGSNRFSNVSVINLSNDPTTGFAIFPNPPSSFINLVLPGDDRSWQIDIIAADGRLVQRNMYYNTSLAVVNFNTRLAPGTYFVRAINALSNDKYTGSFVIAQ